MKRVLRYLGIGLAVVLAVLVVAAAAVYVLSSQKMNEKFDVEVEALVTIPTDEESIARGKYLVEAVALCQDCHGDNLGGKAFIDDPVMAVLDTPNLTSGEGGVGAEFTDEDWVRALRYGVDSEGHSLIIMPSYHYRLLSDEDLGAIIAYVKSLPPVDFEPREPFLGLFRLFMLLDSELGDLIVSANKMDYDYVPPAVMEPAVTAEYGKYLADIACTGCHSEDLSGMPPKVPGAIESSDLTRDGDLKDYTLADFVLTLRTGMKLNGDIIDEDNMPWPRLSRMSDDDLEALWLYLQTLD